MQMAVVLSFAAASAVVQVRTHRRQFAKPRSSLIREKRATRIASYRGNIINDISSARLRVPNPERQLQAYRQFGGDANLLRAFAMAVRQSRKRPSLDAGFVRTAAVGTLHRSSRPYHRNARLHAGDRTRSRAYPELRQTDFYTSHEALLLGYEQR